MAETEPQQADASVLLDLVRQYGAACATMPMFQNGSNARALFDRIAALVPQHPAQARDDRGWPLWQHGCRSITAFADRVPTSGIDCTFCPDIDNIDGPWRPLLVGGDPAPEQLPTDAELDFQIGEVTRERDEARAEIDRLGAERDAMSAHADRPPFMPPAEGPGRREALIEYVETVIGQRADVHGDTTPNKLARGVVTSILHRLGMPCGALVAPDPLVLTLPQVPESAVALVGEDGARWLPAPGGMKGWIPANARGVGTPVFQLGELLDLQEPLTVEMAPPREPRTWDAVEPRPSDLRRVEVAGRVWTFDPEWSRFIDDKRVERRTWAELRTLGPVTEVFEP